MVSTPVKLVFPNWVQPVKSPVSNPPLTVRSHMLVPITPMEKSEGWPKLAVDVKLTPKALLLRNAFWSLPHGKPTQLVPLVSESNERPVPSPIGVTLSQ